MHATTLFLSTIAATVLASPINTKHAMWEPAPGTTSKCDSSDMFISASKSTSLAEQACRNLMPACAFPAFVPEGTFCIQVMDWKLDGTKSVTLNETVVSKDGENAAIGWKAKLTVTPAQQPKDSAGVFWTVGDCTGYFGQLLSESKPKGCLVAETGTGAGSITVGGETSLKDTVFAVSFVQSG